MVNFSRKMLIEVNREMIRYILDVIKYALLDKNVLLVDYY